MMKISAHRELGTSNLGSFQGKKIRSLVQGGVVAAFVSSATGFTLLASTALAQTPFKETRGTLPDGTGYMIRVPEKWNKTLIRDLDYVSGSRNPERADRFEDMLKKGYAVAGTARHPLRQWQYDPAREIRNLDKVLDFFEASYGKPDRVLQYGCSGGAHVTLAISEDFSDRVHGSIALAAHTPVWLMNTFLDGWFALKALIGDYYVEAGHGPLTDLAITTLPNDGSSDASGHGMQGKLPEAWRKAFRAAQATPEGRARIALAFTLGQWPAWMTEDTPQPDLKDPEALQKAMYHAGLHISQSPGGEARIMFENAAQGQQLSWNNDVDYAVFFENGNPSLKRAVDQLYKAAGLDLQADIKKINDTPRIAASSHALEYWNAPGRNVVGNPKIPVLRLHMVGDYQIPYTLMQGYMTQVAINKKEDLVRTAFVRSTGHCNYTAAESSAAIEIMMQRLNTGSWPNMEPGKLNALATSLNTNTIARFMPFDGYEVTRYNRAWIPR